MDHPLERLRHLHSPLHVCVNADGRGSTDYEADDDMGLEPCPTSLLLEDLGDIVIHTWWFDDDDPRSVRAAVHYGDVREVARAVMTKVSEGGHDVRAAGGDFTGPEGATRSVVYAVTGEWIEPQHHKFAVQGERWPTA